MAIKKKPAPKATPKKAAPAAKKAAPKAAPIKKAAPAKKSVPAKKAATPAKKAAPVKKAAPAKKSVPVKKAEPAKKPAVKKQEPAKKVAAPQKSAPKKVAVKAPVKAAPAKKAVAPAKPAAKKPAPAPAKKAPEGKKPEVKAPVAAAKKAAPEAPAKKPAVVKEPKTPKSKQGASKKSPSPATVTKILKAMVNNSSGTPVHPTKPTPAPLGRSLRDEKKAQVIVAHRRLQSENAPSEKKNSFNEFNRSLLDEAPVTPVVGRRYSDEDLAEFRDIINARLENARKELAYLQSLIMRKDGGGTDDSENRFNAEDGSGAMERETVSQLASRQIQFITNLEKALIRIENKTYGVCRVTGKLIDKARLRAVPHATLSIEAKTTMKK